MHQIATQPAQVKMGRLPRENSEQHTMVFPTDAYWIYKYLFAVGCVPLLGASVGAAVIR